MESVFLGCWLMVVMVLWLSLLLMESFSVFLMQVQNQRQAPDWRFQAGQVGRQRSKLQVWLVGLLYSTYTVRITVPYCVAAHQGVAGALVSATYCGRGRISHRLKVAVAWCIKENGRSPPKDHRLPAFHPPRRSITPPTTEARWYVTLVILAVH